ncbi:MAG: exodeoxyribonuclease VII large subunit [Betaproteobacteria bacterium]|nr:exodeoxyribonuclease VII large subunit [Betaproteobacteria bacterium]
MNDQRSVSDAPVIPVSVLNARVRGLLEGTLPLAWVAGEISNFTRAASGHCYFSLKDEQAQVRCVMFRHRAQHLDAPLANGSQVEVRATPTLYEPRGDFQLNVEFVRRAGLGALYEAFERLKRKLEAEGLFAPERKRPLPPWPRAVGVVTSPQAAALRDVLTTLRRRLAAIPVVLYPTLVQGDDAPRQIVAAIDAASDRGDVDVLIVCRGGGSIEDLRAFNDESVARAIARCTIPVIAGVGHETDVTIADFVADARAPTPTGAAVLAVPDGAALARRLESVAAAHAGAMLRGFERRAQRVDAAAMRLRHPGERLAVQRDRVATLGARLARGAAVALDRRSWTVESLGKRFALARPSPEAATLALDVLRTRLTSAGRTLAQRREASVDRFEHALRHLDPSGVLDRGYAIVRNGAGAVVSDAGTLHVDEDVRIQFARGEAGVVVRTVRPD